MHNWGCPLANLNVVAALFKLDQQIGVFSWRSRTTMGDASVVISCTMLADVFVSGAVNSVIVGRYFGEKGEDDAVSIRSENNGGVHF